ncbi:MAG: peptidoglycan bridge formation glycyltransferase FemA/FemB family protein [Candidatus Curtissbacteria bacterium]|nr:peptidoglycan bridge formation glycyltransferase FemA/FemB family protein [Candidatus Curtissbacteria bacterium]
MTVRELTDKDKSVYNKVVSHIIQSWEWGEFRKKTGVDLARVGQFDGKKLVSAYQLTFHSVPYTNQTIGYFPKGSMPTKWMVDSLSRLGREKNAAFIKIEPDVETRNQQQENSKLEGLGLVKSKKSLFTKYNFILDLTKGEEELMRAMHSKTRYNIKVAQKKGVEVYTTDADADFETYLNLYFETTKRQKYFGHTPHYHKLAWETLKAAGMAKILIAKYKGKPLTAWMLLNFGNTLYYPYGGSSIEHREVMASNLVAWEAIKLGRSLGLKNFDMWGALGPDADPKDPWYGFHRFKAGYAPKHVEYVGTWDLVLKPAVYSTLNIAEKIRWIFLRATR